MFSNFHQHSESRIKNPIFILPLGSITIPYIILLREYGSYLPSMITGLIHWPHHFCYQFCPRHGIKYYHKRFSNRKSWSKNEDIGSWYRSGEYYFVNCELEWSCWTKIMLLYLPHPLRQFDDQKFEKNWSQWKHSIHLDIRTNYTEIKFHTL